MQFFQNLLNKYRNFKKSGGKKDTTTQIITEVGGSDDTKTPSILDYLPGGGGNTGGGETGGDKPSLDILDIMGVPGAGDKDKGGILGQMWGTTYDDYIAGQKDLFKDMAQEGYRVGAMKRLPDLMHSAFGGSYATAAAPGNKNLAQIASNSRAYQFNAPALRNSSLNFAALLG